MVVNSECPPGLGAPTAAPWGGVNPVVVFATVRVFSSSQLKWRLENPFASQYASASARFALSSSPQRACHDIENGPCMQRMHINVLCTKKQCPDEPKTVTVRYPLY